ncbi:MAG: hypothetical protein AAF391_06765, partial [Bacteroidota bacterium]
MQLIENFDAAKFKSEKVAAAVKALCELQYEFENARRGNELSGILLSLQNTFPVDKAAIMAVFGVTGTTKKSNPSAGNVRFVDSKKKNHQAPTTQQDVRPVRFATNETAAKKGEFKVPTSVFEAGSTLKPDDHPLDPPTDEDLVNGITEQMVEGCKNFREIIALFSARE